MTSTSAPASCSNAADSRALCPPPITATRLLAKWRRSRWSHECDAYCVGTLSNSGARQANGTIPAAMTTRRAVHSSPLSRLTRKPAAPGSIRRTFLASVSGTARCWNQRPYSMKRLSGIGADR